MCVCPFPADTVMKRVGCMCVCVCDLCGVQVAGVKPTINDSATLLPRGSSDERKLHPLKKKKCFYPPSVQRRGNALAVFESRNSIRATRAVRSSQGAESGPGSHDFLYNCVGIQAEIFLPQKYLTSVYSQWEKKNNALLDGQHVSQGDT